jgi:hypothetical protein
MSSGMASMTALLGMLALAGYQNRDKISEMLRGARRPPLRSLELEHSQPRWADCSEI